jgi:hypothetical protein
MTARTIFLLASFLFPGSIENRKMMSALEEYQHMSTGIHAGGNKFEPVPGQEILSVYQDVLSRSLRDLYRFGLDGKHRYLSHEVSRR